MCLSADLEKAILIIGLIGMAWVARILLIPDRESFFGRPCPVGTIPERAELT
jgi:hypothetical protein